MLIKTKMQIHYIAQKLEYAGITNICNRPLIIK